MKTFTAQREEELYNDLKELVGAINNMHPQSDEHNQRFLDNAKEASNRIKEKYYFGDGEVDYTKWLPR